MPNKTIIPITIKHGEHFIFEQQLALLVLQEFFPELHVFISDSFNLKLQPN